MRQYAAAEATANACAVRLHSDTPAVGVGQRKTARVADTDASRVGPVPTGHALSVVAGWNRPCFTQNTSQNREHTNPDRVVGVPGLARPAVFPGLPGTAGQVSPGTHQRTLDSGIANSPGYWLPPAELVVYGYDLATSTVGFGTESVARVGTRDVTQRRHTVQQLRIITTHRSRS